MNKETAKEPSKTLELADYENFFNTFNIGFKQVHNEIEKKYKFNAFEALKLVRHEEQISYVLAELLKYKEKGEFIFLEIFIDFINKKESECNSKNKPLIIGTKPNVKTEHSIKVENRNRFIDIVIEGENFFIGIENKSNYAKDQDRQVADYYKDLKSKKDITKIIYMPVFSEGPSECSLEGLDKKFYKDVLIMPFCDLEKVDDKGNVIEDNRFSKTVGVLEFLKECKKNTFEERMKFFLYEFIEYIEKNMEGKMDKNKVELIKAVLYGDKNKGNNFEEIAEDIQEYLNSVDGIASLQGKVSFPALDIKTGSELLFNPTVNNLEKFLNTDIKEIKAEVVDDRKIKLITDIDGISKEPREILELAKDIIAYYKNSGDTYDLKNAAKYWIYNGSTLHRIKHKVKNK